jgi:HAD superfamily hydrolase (TIGR01549 family)
VGQYQDIRANLPDNQWLGALLTREEARLTSTAMPWVFFDLGNTLISEEEAVTDRLRQIASAFAACGLRYSEAQIVGAFWQASREFAPRVVTRAVDLLAGNRALRETVLQQITYRKAIERPYPDSRAVLQDVRTIYHIGIIANQSEGTAARLAAYGVAPFIALCLSSTESGLTKPDPAIFREALRRAQGVPERTVMVGDRVDNDIAPAKALGWKTIRVLQGFAKVQQPRHRGEVADATVETLRDVPAVLRRFWTQWQDGA